MIKNKTHCRFSIHSRIAGSMVKPVGRLVQLLKKFLKKIVASWGLHIYFIMLGVSACMQSPKLYPLGPESCLLAPPWEACYCWHRQTGKSPPAPQAWSWAWHTSPCCSACWTPPPTVVQTQLGHHCQARKWWEITENRLPCCGPSQDCDRCIHLTAVLSAVLESHISQRY